MYEFKVVLYSAVNSDTQRISFLSIKSYLQVISQAAVIFSVVHLKVSGKQDLSWNQLSFDWSDMV